MANITGTAGIDTLTGTIADDTIQGLGGDDHIVSSNGSDVIDGGAGNDVLDYTDTNSIVGTGIVYKLDDNLPHDQKFYVNIGKTDEARNYTDQVRNIETIIGSTTGNGSRFNRILFNFPNSRVDLNLAKNQITTSSQLIDQKTLNIKNFHSASIFSFDSRIEGDNQDNEFTIGGKTTIIASKGNDTIYLTSVSSNSGNLSDLTPSNSIIDYSKLNRSVTVTTNIPFTDVPPSRVPLLNIEKNGLGTDKLIGFLLTNSNTFNLSKIIGATDKANTIDGNSKNNSPSIFPLIGLDVNLSKNLLSENTNNAPNPRNNAYAPIEIVNFVNVIGSKLDDKIVGANKNGKLTGGGGNDTITGGNKHDRITGSDRNAKGVGECDVLTGGGGRDKFILGDQNGAYYVGKGNDDYALITDFNLVQDSINLGGFKNYSFAAGDNTIELYAGKDVNNRDLIAKIQIAGVISASNSHSRSIAGSSLNLDSMIAKIDIISGSESSSDS